LALITSARHEKVRYASTVRELLAHAAAPTDAVYLIVGNADHAMVGRLAEEFLSAEAARVAT
jgi:hypothetical protein